MTPELFRQYLQLWKDMGVRKVHWGELYLELGPEVEHIADAPVKEKRSGFHSPALWVTGEPPRFPTKG